MEISANKNKEMPLIEFTEKKKQRLKENLYAPLEPRTQKILEKLKRRLYHFDQQITQEKLEQSRTQIKYWIDRHTAERVTIPNNNFQLFTEGRNSAKMSKYVESLKEELRNAFYFSESVSQNLKGRVTKNS